MTDQEIRESLAYIRAVFPPDTVFSDLIENGARGDEKHTITGDDLAGACWHLNQLLENFGTTS